MMVSHLFLGPFVVGMLVSTVNLQMASPSTKTAVDHGHLGERTVRRPGAGRDPNELEEPLRVSRERVGAGIHTVLRRRLHDAITADLFWVDIESWGPRALCPVLITQTSGSRTSDSRSMTTGYSLKRIAVRAENRASTRGRREDVSSTGCLWVVPVSACPQEFDLVKVDDERLFLGERPAAGRDLCREDRRPRALSSLPLVRR
jgi:hypothetical protein